MIRDYRNPVLPGFNPDPTICRVDRDYYLTVSTFEYFPALPIYHSRNLETWRCIGHALDRPDRIDLRSTKHSDGLYAPTLRFHDGKFYIASTHVDGGGNFIIWAADPRGPWSDPVWIDPHLFDPDLFFDSDGGVYYTRRGGWERGGIVQAPLDIENGRLTGELRVIAEGFLSADVEGPHIYKVGEYYYLMCAEGGTRALHMETIGRGRSPAGPFAPCPHNPILGNRDAWGNEVRSCGHGDLIDDHNGNWWMVHLGTRHHSYNAQSHLGRETYLSPVVWRDGWPIVNGRKPVALRGTGPLPGKPELPPALSPYDFISPRTPVSGAIDLSAAPERVRLIPGEPLDGPLARPALTGIRQPGYACRFSAVIESLEAGQEAGLAVYLNHAFHYRIVVRSEGGGYGAWLVKSVGDMVVESDEIDLPAASLRLAVEADRTRYRFTTGVNDETPIGTGLTQLLGQELPESCFTGVVLALYAVARPDAVQQTAVVFQGIECLSYDRIGEGA